MIKISQKAFVVLQEIIDNENTPDYWKNKFDNLGHKEDIILRGCFKELTDADYIST